MFTWAEDSSCKSDRGAPGDQGRNGGSVDNVDPHTDYSHFHQVQVLSPLIGVNESLG